MTTINQDGQDLVWTARYWRYQSLESEGFGSLEAAARFLEYGEDAGTLASDSIVGPDGSVVHSFQTGDPEDRSWQYTEPLQRETP